jgi:hypothetical protein
METMEECLHSASDEKVFNWLGKKLRMCDAGVIEKEWRPKVQTGPRHTVHC